MNPQAYTATVTLQIPITALSDDDARDQVYQQYPKALAITVTRDYYPVEIEEHDLCAQVYRGGKLSDASKRFTMMVILGLALAALLAAKSCFGASVVTPDFVAWVEHRESRGNPSARGKLDELGCMQLRAIAVREVNRVTGSKWKHRDALDPVKARSIGAAYLRICESRSRAKTREAVYAKYRGAK